MGHYVSGSEFFTPLKKDVRGTQFFEHAIDNVVTQLPVVSAFRAQAFNEVFVAEALMKRDELDMSVCG
ncbi:hypothetical protein D3C75_715290 [compost metagenome]